MRARRTRSLPRADHSTGARGSQRRRPGCRGRLGRRRSGGRDSRSGAQAAPLHEVLLPRLSRRRAGERGQGHVAAAGVAAGAEPLGRWRLACAQPAGRTAAGRAAAASSTPPTLARAVSFLADPRLEGRGSGRARASPRPPTGSSSSSWSRPAAQPVTTGIASRGGGPGASPRARDELTNLVGELPGSDPAARRPAGVVLAHLDHLGPGWPDVRAGNEGTSPPRRRRQRLRGGGAARACRADGRRARHDRDRWCSPWSPARKPGASARSTCWRVCGGIDSPFACVNLDTVGRLGDGKLYVLNADSAREWRFIFMGVGYTTGAPIAVVAEPLDSSDQMSCIEVGVPAVQLFTGPNEDYHRPTDTAEPSMPKGWRWWPRRHARPSGTSPSAANR